MPQTQVFQPQQLTILRLMFDELTARLKADGYCVTDELVSETLMNCVVVAGDTDVERAFERAYELLTHAGGIRTIRRAPILAILRS